MLERSQLGLESEPAPNRIESQTCCVARNKIERYVYKRAVLFQVAGRESNGVPWMTVVDERLERRAFLVRSRLNLNRHGLSVVLDHEVDFRLGSLRPIMDGALRPSSQLLKLASATSSQPDVPP